MLLLVRRSVGGTPRRATSRTWTASATPRWCPTLASRGRPHPIGWIRSCDRDRAASLRRTPGPASERLKQQGLTIAHDSVSGHVNHDRLPLTGDAPLAANAPRLLAWRP